MKNDENHPSHVSLILSKNGEKASSHVLDDDLESIHLVESNELMQMDGKWPDFMTMPSKES
jgi:hypothetical protein